MMGFRTKALLVTGIALLLVLAGCGSDVVNNLEPGKRDMVAEYFKNNPHDVPEGWSRGVLIISKSLAEDCFSNCHTWVGTVVKPDGKTVTLQSEYKEGNWVFDYLPLGADFMWKDGVNFTSLDDVKIIKADPFAATATSAPSSPPTT